MKATARFFVRWAHCLTISLTSGLVFAPLLATGGLDKGVDVIYDLRDQNEKNAWKSWSGYKEAIQDGPPPDPGAGTPWTRDDLEKIRGKNATILKHSNDLAHYQQEILKNDTDLLQKLPPDDPRRAEVQAHRQKIAEQISDTRKTQEQYRGKLGEANGAIDRWRQANDPTYVPPQKTTAPPPAVDNQPPPEPPPPAEPPKTDDGGGSDGGDNGLATLKQKEAEKEAAARALGKERESAVNKYVDDPSEDNRKDAEAIRNRLDGMVDELNGIRGQVDGLDGTSRPPLHVRSAKGIAEEHRRRKASGTNTDGTDTQATGGGGCAVSGSGMEEHHNPDGSDAPNTYQEVGPGGGSGGGGSGKTATGARRGARRTQHSHTGARQAAGSNGASSESHHHTGAMKGSKQQMGGQQRYRGATASAMPNQQNIGQMRNRQAQVQQQQQQRRRRGNGR